MELELVKTDSLFEYKEDGVTKATCQGLIKLYIIMDIEGEDFFVSEGNCFGPFPLDLRLTSENGYLETNTQDGKARIKIIPYRLKKCDSVYIDKKEGVVYFISDGNEITLTSFMLYNYNGMMSKIKRQLNDMIYFDWKTGKVKTIKSLRKHLEENIKEEKKKWIESTKKSFKDWLGIDLKVVVGRRKGC